MSVHESENHGPGCTWEARRQMLVPLGVHSIEEHLGGNVYGLISQREHEFPHVLLTANGESGLEAGWYESELDLGGPIEEGLTLLEAAKFTRERWAEWEATP